ncbi:MAG: tRNA (adenosine(37)-N6)-threonylcarbamoyltransferase complex dimerization subunit type 1 TsaB [Oscillospiraceae bacterium]|nr:tRNA (adenosine(37)-N6)-threonylcarbamoyltransferase complex dimerization subunit type 1 TsaB [Oscillospiraceae bacterium]
MLILAFESSAKAASAALLRDGTLLGEYYQNSGQTHSRTLMQMAADLLRNCDLAARDVDAVAVAAGPGSFTGVRIGVAAAKGFAWSREIPLYGVSTLEAMAETVRHLDGVICAAMDARRSQVYNALFLAENGTLTRLTEDRAISLDELAADLQKSEKKKILIGDGAVLCYNTVSEKIDNLWLLPEPLRMQRASGVALAAARMAARGERPMGGALAPNYLRLSQAEREKNARRKGTKNG